MRTGRAHILELLRSHRPIAEQIDRKDRQDGLLGEVRAQLPIPERPHCVQASRHGDQLTLTLDSAAWATRLRYRIPDLLTALGPSGVTAIRVRIQPPGQGSPGRFYSGLGQGRAPRGIRLSATVVSHLLAAADEIADPGIAEVLRRLARRHGGGGAPPSMG
jgi:hypothetical protein